MKLSLRLLLVGLLGALAVQMASSDSSAAGDATGASGDGAEETPKGKPLDLLVWGATGFTGRWVAEYLIKQYGVHPEDFKWGIGE
jgi:hypothetical protein